MIRFGLLRSFTSYYVPTIIILFCFLANADSALAYYNPDSNIPAGNPPNYNLVDTILFEGNPGIPMPYSESGGYYIFWDQGKWNIISHLYSTGGSLEQFHGSILAVMEQPPQLNVNVFIDQFELWEDTASNKCLHQNDRWGWVEWDTNLYEIWWDVTTKEFKADAEDVNDFLSIQFIGCAVDFNIWSSSHGGNFAPDQVFLGANKVPLSDVSGFSDTYPGIFDPYQSQAGSDSKKAPNITTFTALDLPGNSYNANGLIQQSDSYVCDGTYGTRYSGAFVYEGNGIQFSPSCISVPNNPPELVLPNDSLVIFCSSSEFCFEVTAFDNDAGDLITLSLLEGPVDFIPLTAAGSLTDTICFLPTIGNSYQFVFMVEDLEGLSQIDTVVFTFESGAVPVVNDQYFSARQCNLTEDRIIEIIYDNQWNDWTFELLAGPGTIDPFTGAITYRPDTSGIFTFTIAALNNCGADTAFIYDTLVLNTPPQVYCQDSTIYLCQADMICFDIFGFDPDSDPIEIFKLEGLGDLTMLDDSSGRVCFTPADIDSFTYQFVFRAADSCLLGLGMQPPAMLDCCQDTALITVIINQPPVITCPGPQAYFTCDGGEFCFNISAVDPDNDSLIYNILSGNASIDGNTVCVTAYESTQLDVVIEVVDECGLSDTCTVPVTIEKNHPPVVSQAPDFDITLCQTETICFGANADDIDFNIDSVWVNFGYYDQNTHRICFDPDDTSGVYSLSLYAVDSCGLLDSSVTRVTVKFNEPPVISLGEDFTDYVCDGEEVCIEPAFSDSDNNIKQVVTSDFTYYNEQTGFICFVPDTSGTYLLWAKAIDDCDEFGIDSLLITINIREAPYVNLGEDTSIFMCGAEEVCIDVNTIADYAALNPSLGTFNPQTNQVCFTPDNAGIYTLIVDVFDSCNVSISDTINIEIIFNDAPLISNFDDQEIYLCYPEMVCLPVTIDDINNNIDTIIVNRGSYDNGQICFVPYDSGNFQVVVRVIDECGLEVIDTAFVHVLTDQNVSIIAPGDTAFFVCELDTFCFPVYGIPDNADVTVAGINTWYNPQTQMICYYPECSSTNNITLTVTTPCNTFEKQFSVTVVCNTSPLVILPPDTNVVLCEPSEICIPVGISDVDNNLIDTLINGGSYNSITDEICFYAGTSGVYTIQVTAVDSCQVTDFDEIIVTVEVNSSPVCSIPGDTIISLCSPEQISLPVSAVDADNNLVECVIVSGPGALVNDNWVYNAVVSDSFAVVIRCTDECNVFCEDSFTVIIDMNEAPVCSIPVDQTFYQCTPSEVTVPFSAYDPDGDSVQCFIIGGPGVIINNFWVYTPSGNETVDVTVRCKDSCGLYCEGTFTATFIVNDTPFVSLGNDFDTTLCDSGEICIVVNTIDYIQSVITSPGSYYNEQAGQLCFTPVSPGNYTLSIEITDTCGLTAYDEINLNVQINNPPEMSQMPDTTVYLCYPELICLPLTVFDIDNNIDSITVNRGSYQDSMVCFVPYDSGQYEIIVTAYDRCGAVIADTAVVNVLTDQAVSIICPSDTTLFVCQLDTFCFPIEGIPNNSTVEVTGINTWFDEQTNNVCFYAECAVTNTITVNVASPCGPFSCQFTVTVECNTAPLVILPPDTAVGICDVTEICIPVGITDVDNNIDSIIVEGGSFDSVASTICFTANMTGTYTLRLTAFDACLEEDFDEIMVTVNLNSAPYIIVPTIDSTFHICDGDSICFPVEIGDVDNNLFDVTLSLGNYHEGSGQICFSPDTAGIYSIAITAVDVCGIEAIDTAYIDVMLNTPPVVLANDTTFILCVLDTVCFPFEAIDSDNNIVEITTSLGIIAGNQVCFLPTDYGNYDVVIMALDECGDIGADTALITVSISGEVAILCPGAQADTLCGADTVCVLVPITPSDAQVSIYDNGQLSDATYNPSTGKLCLFVTQPGSHSIRVIAESGCNADTCDFNLQVIFEELPAVLSPDSISTQLCLVQPDTFCFPIEITGTNVQVSVVPVGEYLDGNVCVPISQEGINTIKIIAVNDCGIDSSITILEITADQPPQLILPDTLVFERCPDDSSLVCIDGIKAADADSIVYLIKTCGPGTFDTVTVDSGEICFLPDYFGIYEFCFEAFDGCSSVEDTFYVNVVRRVDCDVCVRVSIDGGDCAPVGTIKEVLVNVSTNDAIGGFELLVSFDASVVAFNGATIEGTDIEAWEYFTYRLGSDDCGSSCPSGLVRFIGIADINDGPNHPPDSSFTPEGELIKMNFSISYDQNLGGQFLPMNFVWYNCSDNTFSDPTGNLLYMDNRIFNAEDSLIWDEADDINYPDSSRPFGMGAGDSCTTGGPFTSPERCVEFVNGGICIIPPQTLNDRGDLNLNGVPYEIADAVLYSNYFIYGLSVFTVDLPRQIAASDINADGLTLSVADLVLLIRIIIGDADPIPKLVPYEEKLTVTLEYMTDKITISSDAVSDIGAALMVYDIDDEMKIEDPRLASDIKRMELGYIIEDGQLRILIYNFGTNKITSGSNNLVEIPYSGKGELTLSKIEFVDYYGRPYEVVSKASRLPESFSLNQNYPNPFNPETNIDFALPIATEWNLTIYNINGHLVKRFSGYDEAGMVTVKWNGDNSAGSQVASGVYLYRLEAGSFKDTKKMILLK